MQQQQGQPIIIVGPDGTEHEFPAGMDPKKAAEIVRSKLSGPSLTPESVFGPVGKWLQTNVQPKLEQAAYAVKRASGLGPSGIAPVPSVFDKPDIEGPMRRALGAAISGTLETLAHPIENAETLAPIAVELARAYPPFRTASGAASLFKALPRTSPSLAAVRATLQGAERSALAGGAGAGLTAADANAPILPAMQTGALRQGAGDLVAGGVPLGIGAGSRMLGRAGGYRALDPSMGSLTSVWMAEGKAPREFTESRAKRLVKDLMTQRSEGRIGGDAYFDTLHRRTNEREAAREAMFDSTLDAESSLPKGEYSVGLKGVASSVKPAAKRAARLEGFAPEAAATGISATGRRFLQGREGINLPEIQIADAAQRSYQQALKAASKGKLPTPERQAYQEALSRAPLARPTQNKLEQLRASADQADAAYLATLKANADTAEAAAKASFEKRWAPGTADALNMRELPLDIKNASEILRSMDRTQAADLQKFMADVQGRAEFNPTPKQKGQAVLRQTLNEEINAVAPPVRWQGEDVPYQDFRKDYSRDIAWRDMAGQAGGSGSMPRGRVGWTISGRPFANLSEGVETLGGALARPMISFGEGAMRGAAKIPSAGRLAWLLASNQPDETKVSGQPFQVNLQDLLNRLR